MLLSFETDRNTKPVTDWTKAQPRGVGGVRARCFKFVEVLP